MALHFRISSCKRRIYNVRLVKRDFAYTICEIAQLFDLHPQAVRRWPKAGLRTIDDRRPFLIHGSDLIDFLRSRQLKRKRKCRPDELYCCRCREPRRARENRVDIEILNDALLNIAAICDFCGTHTNRAGSTRKLEQYSETFTVQTRVDRRLGKCSDPGVNTHLGKENEDAAIQPQE